MRHGRAAGVAALLVGLTGCGGSGGSAEEAGTEPSSAALTTTEDSSETTTSSAAKTTNGSQARVTGFAATRESWISTHEPDPDPKLIEGCCFLPRTADGGDRYYAVFWNENDHVYGYSMQFDEPLTPREAREVARREAPRGAKLVFDVKKPTCRMLQYRSPAIERALGKGQGMTVALYSSDTGERFTGRVAQLIFNALPLGDKSFGC